LPRARNARCGWLDPGQLGAACRILKGLCRDTGRRVVTVQLFFRKAPYSWGFRPFCFTRSARAQAPNGYPATAGYNMEKHHGQQPEPAEPGSGPEPGPGSEPQPAAGTADAAEPAGSAARPAA